MNKKYNKILSLLLLFTMLLSSSGPTVSHVLAESNGLETEELELELEVEDEAKEKAPEETSPKEQEESKREEESELEQEAEPEAKEKTPEESSAKEQEESNKGDKEESKEPTEEAGKDLEEEVEPEDEGLEEAEEFIDEMGANPDGLSGPELIEAPYIKTYALASLGPTVSQMFKSTKMATSNHPGDHDNIEPPAAGSLDISKKASITADPNQWKIDLKLTGKDIPSSSDIVLVIDTSGSMGQGTGRMEAAKEAAKNFVNTLLDDDDDTRIAVVSFASNVTEHSGFQGFNGKASLISDIEGLNANGGTFIQAGLKQASALLDGSSADNKNIVLLGDGAATYSYKINNPNNYLESWYSEWLVTHKRTTSAVPESEFDYDNTAAGNGTSDHTQYESGWRYRNHYRHGASSIAEAGFAKAKGYEIYTVALGAGTEGDWTLDGIADPGKAYTGSNDDLEKIFQTIAGSISYAATDATITDPMGEMFSIPGINASNYQDKITVNRGTISWDDATETITWNLNTISEGNPATMSYIVEIDEDAVSKEKYPTNKHTYVDYTNALDKDARKTFSVPKVGIDAGRIQVHYYRVNAEGQPINSIGQVITKEQAELESYDYGSEALEFNTPYEIIGPVTISVSGVDYQYNSEGNVGDPNPTDVTLTPENPSEDVWFGYEEIKNISIDIKKKVTGNMGDMEGYFSFIVGVKGEDEPRTFELSNGETETLDGIPRNAQLTLTETDSKGHDVTVKINNTEIPVTDGKYIIDLTKFTDEDITIEVINHREGLVDTGISLDSSAYILILLGAMFGLAIKVFPKKDYE